MPVPRGRDLLRDPRFNRGTAFTAEQRAALGLTGLLPVGVLALEEQVKRSYQQYQAQPDDLARNTFLAALHDRNEVLYYRLLAEHLFPHALLHFEDFGASNARRILNTYRDTARVFNDDIQGTGAITVAAVLAGLRVARSRPSEQRVVVFDRMVDPKTMVGDPHRDLGL